MRQIIASAFISLDGVMQAPGGPDEDTDGGFKFGGWVQPGFDETAGAAIDAVLSGDYDLLLGRKTYDIFAGFWPNVTSPDHPDIGIARDFNKATKYVATRAGTTPRWDKTVVLGRNLGAELTALKAGDGPKIVVQGSANLLQSLWALGLLDELTVMTFPVVLGSGKRLFEAGAAPVSLELTSSTVSPRGVVIATYVPGGPVETGAFTPAS